jgi:asparagine synthase (glutamine-hydrolysing)
VTAIAGFLAKRRQEADSAFACDSLLSKLRAYGRNKSHIGALGSACFGRALTQVLPEERFDQQPLISGERFLLAFDGRLDNRNELALELSIGPTQRNQSSDADLFLAAWERWQLGCFDHLVGDFAFAVWDAEERRLTLVRGPLSSRGLFYHHSTSEVAFASLPQPLLVLPSVSRQLEVAEIVAIAAAASTNGPDTVFAGIKRVPQGCAVSFDNERDAVERRLWRLGGGGGFGGSLDDCAEALRAELDRAVAAQLRRQGGFVACQLSSGRDSSAVLATAARQLGGHGERLLALTGAPHNEFNVDPKHPLLCDESGIAGLTAAKYRNVDHVICRPDPGGLIDQLDQLHSFHHGPLLNPSNLPWWGLINTEAKRRGSSILLTGAHGNFSVSAGGAAFLPDLRRRRGTSAWLRRTREIATSPLSCLRVLKDTFGGHLPRPIYDLGRLALGKSLREGTRVPFLREPYREQAERHLKDYLGDNRPARSGYEHRKEMLYWSEPAEKISLAQWGIDVRDPTADRRLVELCYSFPPELLASSNARRPIFEAAFQGSLPKEVRICEKRGYQTADWADQFSVEEVGAAFHRYHRNSNVKELIDLNTVEDLLGTWPRSNPYSPSAIGKYRNGLLGTLALASFINLHFPE